MENRSEEINQIIDMIDQYLEGQLSASEVARWGLLKITEDPGSSDPPTKHELLVGEGWGALMMLSDSEPEEYRTTEDQLILIRNYLSGDEEYPYEEKLRALKSK
jgi:hypothetical protein